MTLRSHLGRADANRQGCRRVGACRDRHDHLLNDSADAPNPEVPSGSDNGDALTVTSQWDWKWCQEQLTLYTYTYIIFKCESHTSGIPGVSLASYSWHPKIDYSRHRANSISYCKFLWLCCHVHRRDSVPMTETISVLTYVIRDSNSSYIHTVNSRLEKQYQLWFRFTVYFVNFIQRQLWSKNLVRVSASFLRINCKYAHHTWTSLIFFNTDIIFPFYLE